MPCAGILRGAKQPSDDIWGVRGDAWTGRWGERKGSALLSLRGAAGGAGGGSRGFGLAAGEGLWARRRRGAAGRTGRGSFRRALLLSGSAQVRQTAEPAAASGPGERRGGGRGAPPHPPPRSLPPSSGAAGLQPAESLIYKVSRPSSWKYLRLVYNGCNSLLIYPAPSPPPPFLFFFFYPPPFFF